MKKILTSLFVFLASVSFSHAADPVADDRPRARNIQLTVNISGKYTQKEVEAIKKGHISVRADVSDVESPKPPVQAGPAAIREFPAQKTSWFGWKTTTTFLSLGAMGAAFASLKLMQQPWFKTWLDQYCGGRTPDSYNAYYVVCP